MPITEKLSYMLIGFLVIIGIGFIGSSDYDDQTLAQEHYCNMVELNVWPDYKENYDKACKDT